MIVGTSVSVLPSGDTLTARTKNLSEAHYPCSVKAVGWAADAALEVSRMRMFCLKVGKESSERRYVGDAWAHRGDEGRGKLR